MKNFLIILNFILAILIGWNLFSALTGGEESEIETPVRRSVRKPVAAKPEAPTAAEKNTPAPAADTVEARNSLAKTIVESDVFNAERSPASGGRLELTLVGTFKIGDLEGAIIRINAQRQRQINPFMRMMMPGGPGNAFQRGGNRSGATRQRFGGGNWMSNSGNSNTAGNRQYVRIGDTLDNGYTLTEVTRTRAILARGSDKMELELQDPSKNAVARRSGGQRLNTNQQLQQAQLMTQQMLMRTLMNMNNNRNAPRPQSSTRSGNRGGRR